MLYFVNCTTLFFFLINRNNILHALLRKAFHLKLETETQQEYC